MALFPNGFMPALSNNSDALLQAGLGLLSGRTGPEQAAMGLQGFTQARKENKTAKWLADRDPELAAAMQQGLISGGDAFKIWAQKTAEASKPKTPLEINGKLVDPTTYEVIADFSTPPKQEDPYRNVGGALYDTSTGSWITPPVGPSAAGGGELGLNVVWGKDAKGNPVAFQPSKSGGLVPANVPEGVTLSDPYNRSLDTTLGKGAGEANLALPQVSAAADQMISTIDSLATDPYLPEMVGPYASKLPNVSSEAARVQSKMDQIGGQTFLQAFNSLRGAGQITEQEGARATAAMSRLNTAQTEADYKAALNELRNIVIDAKSRAQTLATPRGGQAMGQPSGGGVVDYGTYFNGQ